MPGERALLTGQYYAHPRNQFWMIMGDLYGAHKNLAYEERLKILDGQGIGIGDVVASCRRCGSSDAAMKDICLADFEDLFRRFPAIKVVIFDSRSAQNLYTRLCLSRLPAKLTYRQAPSPSPAYASLSYEEKLAGWKRALAV